MAVKQVLFFTLACVSPAWTKPLNGAGIQTTDLQIMRRSTLPTAPPSPQVQEQMDFCLVSGRNALNIEVIYQHDVLNGHLWLKKGSLPDCSSESEPVPLEPCRVCKKNDEEVEATCRRVRSSDELRFEGNGTTLQKSCSSHVITPTPTPPTQSMATPLQSGAAPPPGPGAGVIAGICGVLGVLGVGVGVAYTKREKIKSWWSRRRTRVPTMDQEMSERAPAANGPAPPPLEAPGPETLGLEVSLKDSFSE